MKKLLLQFTCAITISILAITANAQNVCLLDSMYQYNSSNSPTRKNYYSYNSNQLRSEWYTKDSVNGAWLNNFRYAYTYNSAGKTIENLSQNWVNNAWRNNQRTTYTYDSNNNVLTERQENWDTLTSTWYFQGFQKNYTYNLNNKVTLYDQAYLNNNVPNDSVKHLYTYDSNGREIIMLRQGWTSSNPVWNNLQEYSTVYNSNNLIDSIYNRTWNNNTSTFDNWYLTTSVYNSNGKETENHQFNWTGAGWANNSKSIMTYDANNNKTSSTSYYWLTITSIWRATSANHYTFDSNNNTTSGLGRNYDYAADSLVNSWLTNYFYNSNNYFSQFDSYTWDINNSNWNFSGKYVYYYDCDGSLSIVENTTPINNIYPNPANNRLNIDLVNETEVEIYSLTGILMDKFSAKQNHIVDISAYPNGMYFVKTENETIKFVKQ